MRKKQRATPTLKIGQILIAVFVIGALALGGLTLFQRFAPGTGKALRDSDTAFSIPTHVGQPAPKFTAIGVDGQPYTLTPGDGRLKAIVFYMGFR